MHRHDCNNANRGPVSVLLSMLRWMRWTIAAIRQETRHLPPGDTGLPVDLFHLGAGVSGMSPEATSIQWLLLQGFQWLPGVENVVDVET